jgi:DNA-binding HxlR family transcriptional regulator
MAEVEDENEKLVREMLARIADQWSLLAILTLEEGEQRFGQLRKKLEGVSQKMLTKTLRQLERDGLLTRTVHPEVPPRVVYRLTALGESLAEAVCPIWHWAEAHLEKVAAARASYDSE